MTTATRTRKTTKQKDRSVNLMTLSDDTKVLWLTIDGDTQAYGLTPIDSDFGTAFRLMKADRGDGHMDEYDVLMHGRETSCTCPGHTYKNRCKHVDVIAALVQTGKLAVREPEPQPEDEDEEIVEITAEPPAPRQPELCSEPRCHRPVAHGGMYCGSHSWL